MMTPLIKRTLCFAITALVSAEIPALEKGAVERAIRLQLSEGFNSAYELGQSQLAAKPGSVLLLTTQLNTLVTASSWDPEDQQFDDAIEHTARQVLQHCDDNDHACGLGHFSLSYLFALRGKYLASANRATKAISALESALQRSPEQVDPKLHLGVLYYYADNLPPFVKAVGRVLWFVPKGHGDQAIPYVRAVIAEGEEYQEGARFILADLLSQGNDNQRQESVVLFRELISDYPQNPRLHYNLLEALASLGRHAEVLAAYNRAVELIPEKLLESDHQIYLQALSAWQARAMIELHQLEAAKKVMDNLNRSHERSLPEWLIQLVKENQLLIQQQQMIAHSP